MSFFATGTYSSQSGGLATFSHCSPAHQQHKQTVVAHGGAVLLHSAPRQQQQQQQQQQQLVVATTTEEQTTTTPATATATSQQQLDVQQQIEYPTTSIINPFKLNNNVVSGGYDVIDNKTTESIPIHMHQRYIMNDIFHREDERLKTFDTWPLDWLDKHLLAQTGMFFTGEDDKVKCYFCEVEIGRWEQTDHPVSEHLRWFPNCPLLRRRTTNNVAIDAEALDHILPPVSYDICGANDSICQARLSAGLLTDNMILNNCGSADSDMNMMAATNTIDLHATTPTTNSTNTTTSTTTTTSQQQQINNYYPEYPEYAIESARLRSFAEWPINMKQKPEQLAEAGFFYIGSGDRVKCFSCGGGLKDWADDDEPWEQHTLWMSKCRFLKLMKGQNYIDNVLSKKQKEKEDHNSIQLKHNQLSADLPKYNTNNATNASLIVGNAATNLNIVDINVAVSQPIVENAANNDNQQQQQEQQEHQQVEEEALTDLKEQSSQQQQQQIALNCCINNSSSNNNMNILNLGTTSSATSSCSNITTAATVTSATPATIIPEEKLCKICYADEYNTAFLPCGHVVACAKCASSVTKCPLCRKPFTDVMRVYFS